MLTNKKERDISIEMDMTNTGLLIPESSYAIGSARGPSAYEAREGVAEEKRPWPIATHYYYYYYYYHYYYNYYYYHDDDYDYYDDYYCECYYYY